MGEQLGRAPRMRGEHLRRALCARQVRSLRLVVSKIRKPGGVSLRCPAAIATEPCFSVPVEIVAAAIFVWLEAIFAARTWTDISSPARGKVASVAETLARHQAASVVDGRLSRKVSGIPSRVRRGAHGESTSRAPRPATDWLRVWRCSHRCFISAVPRQIRRCEHARASHFAVTWMEGYPSLNLS